jgi:hypothetical protein
MINKISLTSVNLDEARQALKSIHEINRRYLKKKHQTFNLYIFSTQYENYN